MNGSILINEVGSGKAVVFIHGLGSSSHCWNDQVIKFSDQFKVITIDLYGHGQNKNIPSNIDISQTAKETIEEFQNRNLYNISLVGHSLDGLIAIEITRLNNELVDNIILVDVPTKQPNLPTIMKYVLLKLLENSYEATVKAHYKKMTEDQDLLKSLLSTALNTNKHVYCSYMKSVLNANYSKIVGSLKSDIYIFLSTSLAKDKYKLNKIKRKYGYENITDDRVYYYKDAGHFIMLEKTKRFTRDILNILSQ